MPIDKSLKTESSEFRLFRCDHGCFHLEWKYFAIVHMTAEHLLRLYQQLVGVCDRSSAVEQACEAGCVCLECNDDIQIESAVAHHNWASHSAQPAARLGGQVCKPAFPPVFLPSG